MYKKFEDLVNFQHVHGGRTDLKFRQNKQLSYWVESQRTFYRQFLRDEHKQPTSERKSDLENIECFWMIEKGSVGKGPTRKKNKILDD